jgi:hypothetical protein
MDEFGDLIDSNLPNDVPIDFIATVNDAVAHPDHFPPRNLGMCIKKVLGQAVRSLADNDDLPEDRRLFFVVLHERRKIYSSHEANDS